MLLELLSCHKRLAVCQELVSDSLHTHNSILGSELFTIQCTKWHITLKKTSVITTINRFEQTFVASLTNRNYTVIVVADLKTPIDSWNRENIILVHDNGMRKWKRLARLLPYNHYCRKNLGYLYAADAGAGSILETDDDNDLTSDINCWKHLEFKTVFGSQYPNILTEFTEHPIWARGYPLELVNTDQTKLLFDTNKEELERVGVVQSLVNGDPDVDAIFRLTSPHYSTNTRFSPNKGFLFPSGTYTQGNTQATLWPKPELYHLTYIPATVSFRFCDILKMYVAQRCMWEYGDQMAVVSPFFRQERNVHDFMSDFKSEDSMYHCVHDLLARVLPSIKLKGQIDDLVVVYKRLAREGIVEPGELTIVKTWVKAFEKL